jgi:DNA-binding GntR family transcriptional regulator
LLELCRRKDADAVAGLLTRHIEDITDVLYEHLK